MGRRQHRISLDSVRLLDAIERLGSFAAAAQELCVVTSSVTHAVRNLEEQLGLQIFDRSGRRARFTDRGRALLDRGRALLAQAEAFDEAAQLLATGWERSLVLCVDQVLPLAPLVPLCEAFFETAPGTSLLVRREAAAGSWDALLSGRADLAVGAPAPGPASGGFESLPLLRIPFVLAVAASHPLAGRRDRIANAEIAQHRSVVMADTARGLPRLPYGLLDHRQCLSVPDAETKLQAILQGIGCGFLPQPMARPLVRAGRLALLDVETPHPPGQALLAWRAGESGRALHWWREQLAQPGLARRLLG